MKKNTKRRRTWIIVLLALLGLLATVALVVFVPGRVRARFSRPLVMIHNPIRRQVITRDENVLVHATARNERGINRMELWVDGDLFAEKEQGDEGSITPFVLQASWQPMTEGEHVLVVRAFSEDGTEGQAAVTVEVLEEASLGTHEVQEGESLEEIAEEYGTTEDELQDLNPELTEEDPAPGDELDVPLGGGEAEDDEGEGRDPAGEGDDGEGDGAGEDGPGEGEDPPDPHGDPPGGFELGDFFFGLDLEDWFDAADDGPARLVVEILSFETEVDYDDVHCYVSLGDDPWFVIWDAVNMSTGVMTALEWPGDQPLLLTSTCEGITSGGLASDDLGQIQLRVPPEEWDSVVRQARSLGGESAHTVEYRIGYEEERVSNVDPDMTPPTNLILDPMRYALRWEYHPRPEEAPIDGFRIFLNDNLQWIEPAEARASDLPPEWLRPPCGETYTFTVTAFRGSTLIGPESAPTDPPVVVEADESCQKEFMVTFLTFRTYDLPGDGRYEDRTGDLGPVYGHFFANEERETFSTGRLGEHFGSLDVPVGITAHTTYDLEEFAENTTRSWSGLPVSYVDLPEEDVLSIGYHILDNDEGAGSDDLLCEAEAQHFNGPTAELDRTQEYTLRSDNGRCEITYTIGLAPGSAVGSPDTEYPPLPWLEIVDLRYDDEGTQYQIDVQNTGTATWPYRNLTIGMVSREGDFIGTYNWEEFGLEPGQTRTLTVDDPESYGPMALCPMLDPDNELIELYEALGTRRHVPYCPPLPDLTILDVDYEPTGSGRLRVTIQNRGEGALVNRVMGLETTLADGSPAYLARSWPDVTLNPGETTTRDLIGVSDTIYEMLQDGYTVQVDPDGLITESEEENNDYSVSPSVTVRFVPEQFFSGRAAENLLQCRAETYFRIEVGHGHSLDDAEWISQRYPRSGELVYLVDHFICAGDDPGPWVPDASYQMEVEMPSDENFYIRLSGYERDGSSNRDSLGEIFLTYAPDENYGEGPSGSEAEGGGWDHWVWSSRGSCNDARPYGTPWFQARWRIEIVE